MKYDEIELTVNIYKFNGRYNHGNETAEIKKTVNIYKFNGRYN